MPATPTPPTASMTNPPSEVYTWQGYQCAYAFYPASEATTDSIPLLLLHPIGVGLSRYFWHRFCNEWRQGGYGNAIYNPDLL